MPCPVVGSGSRTGSLRIRRGGLVNVFARIQIDTHGDPIWFLNDNTVSADFLQGFSAGQSFSGCIALERVGCGTFPHERSGSTVLMNKTEKQQRFLGEGSVVVLCRLIGAFYSVVSGAGGDEFLAQEIMVYTQELCLIFPNGNCVEGRIGRPFKRGGGWGEHGQRCPGSHTEQDGQSMDMKCIFHLKKSEDWRRPEKAGECVF